MRSTNAHFRILQDHLPDRKVVYKDGKLILVASLSLSYCYYAGY